MVSDGQIPPVDGVPPATGGSGRFAFNEDSASTSMADFQRYVAELIANVRLYARTQAARIRVAVRNVLLLMIVGIVAATIAATILVSATVLLCIGIADGLGALLGGRQWAGDLVTGILVLGAIAVGSRIVIRRMIRSARERTRQEYE